MSFSTLYLPPKSNIFFAGDYAPSSFATVSNKLLNKFSPSDILIFNFEGLISSCEPTCDNNFYTPYINSRLIEYFLDHGVTVCANLSNNHTLDGGLVGLKKTIDSLLELNILPFGLKSNLCSLNLRIRTPSCTLNIYPVVSQYLINHLHHSCRRLYNDVLPSPSFKASHINIVLSHDGVEFIKYPDPLLFYKYCNPSKFINYIFNCHQHIPLEISRRNDTIIAYSMGNFAFDCHLHQFEPTTKTGLLLRMTSHGLISKIYVTLFNDKKLFLEHERNFHAAFIKYSVSTWLKATRTYTKKITNSSTRLSTTAINRKRDGKLHYFLNILYDKFFYYWAILRKPSIILFKLSSFLASRLYK